MAGAKVPHATGLPFTEHRAFAPPLHEAAAALLPERYSRLIREFDALTGFVAIPSGRNNSRRRVCGTGHADLGTEIREDNIYATRFQGRRYPTDRVRQFFRPSLDHQGGDLADFLR
jgi:hypothetical protein